MHVVCNKITLTLVMKYGNWASISQFIRKIYVVSDNPNHKDYYYKKRISSSISQFTIHINTKRAAEAETRID